VGKGCRVSLYGFLLYNWVIKGLCGFWHDISGGLSKGYQGLSKYVLGYQRVIKGYQNMCWVIKGLPKSNR